MSDELKLPNTVVRALTVLARAGYVGTSPAGIASYLVMRGIDDLIRAGVVKHTDLLGKGLSAPVENAAAQEPAPQQSAKPAQNMHDPMRETSPTEGEGRADRDAGPKYDASAGECASDRVAGADTDTGCADDISDLGKAVAAVRSFACSISFWAVAICACAASLSSVNRAVSL